MTFFEKPILIVGAGPVGLTLAWLLNEAGINVRLFEAEDKISNQLNQYFYRNNNFFHDLRIKMRYKSWSKNIKFCATSEEMFPHAEPYFDKVYIFRQPIDLKRIEPSIPNNEIDKPIILHTPTEPLVKGTKHVIEAIENLKKK